MAARLEPKQNNRTRMKNTLGLWRAVFKERFKFQARKRDAARKV